MTELVIRSLMLGLDSWLKCREVHCSGSTERESELGPCVCSGAYLAKQVNIHTKNY
jgi:hypothetical protein